MKNQKVKWPDPYPGAHWLDEREDRAVLDVLHRRALFRYYGINPPRHAAAFEQAAREFYGVKYALGVNSGTGALFTAMTARGWARMRSHRAGFLLGRHGRRDCQCQRHTGPV